MADDRKKSVNRRTSRGKIAPKTNDPADHEQLQYTNEELMSANEELQSENEKLQALNEELLTVNAQLQRKVEELNQTNSDMGNFFASEETTRRTALFTLENPEPVMRIKADGTILFANRSAESMLQIWREESGKDLPPPLLACIKKALSDKSATAFEIDNEGRTISLSVIPFPWKGYANLYGRDTTEMKQAEETERRARETWERTFDSVPDLIAILDRDHRIVRANRAMAERLGMTAEECIGKHCYQCVHGTDAPPGICPHTLTLADGKGHVAEIQEPHLSRDFLVSTTPLTDENGEMFGTVHVARDITERKKMENALRKSEQHVRLKLNSILEPGGDIGELTLKDIVDIPAIQSLINDFYHLSGIPMGLFDLNGDVLISVGWQPVCTKFHRTHPDTLAHCLETNTRAALDINKNEYGFYRCKNHMWDISTPIRVGGKHLGNLSMGQFFFEDESVDYDLFRAQARKYGFDESEYLEALDAVPRFSRETIDRARAFSMKFTEIISKLSYGNIKLARSLAEEDRLMTSLRRSEERLKRAQEISHVGSWELDLVDNVLTWSDEVYRIFGIDPHSFEATYESFLEAVHPEDRSEVDAAYSNSLKEEKDTYEIEHRVIRKSTGEVRYVHEKCEHFRDEAGRLVRSVGMVHDVTERNQSRDALKKTNNELEVTNRELESFVYSVSHDLRGPLRSISGFGDILKKMYEDRLDEKGLDYLSRIGNGAKKMNTLIDDLLRLSRISRQGIDQKPIDISKMASDIVNELKESSPGRDVQVKIEPGLIANADPHLIEVMLSNLLRNAWKFTAKNKTPARIELKAIHRDGKVVYCIRDNGAGFNPDYDKKMFLPFHRLHTENEFEGTGIGLAIVDRIIQRHGGCVWAEGAVGTGASIFFTLD